MRKQTALYVLRGLEHPDRETAIPELAAEFTAQQMIKALQVLSLATISVRGLRLPDYQLRQRAQKAMLSVLFHDTPPPKS